MTKRRSLLAVSLICNAILLAWIGLSASSPDAPAPLPATGAEPPSSGLAAWFARLHPANDRPSGPAAPGTDAGYAEAGWTRSLYDDVAELRERGFDDATVRLLALAEAERLFRERARAVLAPEPRGYWEPDPRVERISPSQLAVYQRLRREKLAAIEELAGPDAQSMEANTAYTFMAGPRMRGLDWLPPDKQLALTEYMEIASAEQLANLHPLERLRRGGNFGMAYAEQMAAREEQIRVILGPELFDQYVVRSSQAAARLRSELAAFRPTRAEFDALAAIEYEQRARRAQSQAFSAAAGSGKMQALADERTQAIRAVLGEQRFAEYQRSREYSFMHLDRIARELNLAPDVVRATSEVLEQSRARMQRFRERNALDPQVQREMQAAQRELRAALVEKLGLADLKESEINLLLRGMTEMPMASDFPMFMR